jgi:AcrR family transcriptional regulator
MLTTTGLSSSSLYRTFGTKTETFEAVLRRYLELSDGMLKPLEHGAAGVADLHGLFDRLYSQMDSPAGAAGCLMVASAQNPVNHDPKVSALTCRHLARMRSAIAAAVTRADQAGEPLPTAPDSFAAVLYAAMLGILSSARTGDRATTLALVEAVRTLLPEPATDETRVS